MRCVCVSFAWPFRAFPLAIACRRWWPVDPPPSTPKNNLVKHTLPPLYDPFTPWSKPPPHPPLRTRIRPYPPAPSYTSFPVPTPHIAAGSERRFLRHPPASPQTATLRCLSPPSQMLLRLRSRDPIGSYERIGLVHADSPLTMQALSISRPLAPF